MRTRETFSDDNLPGLNIALSKDAFIQLLVENLPECRNGIRLLDARLVNVQYAPSSSAEILWKLKIEDPERRRTSRQLVFVKVLRRHDPAPAEPAELVRRYNAIRERRNMARVMPLRTPWVLAPGAGVLIHAFPLDPELPTLMDVADPHAMREALHQIWRPRRVAVRRVRVDTLAYTPGQRAALSYEVLAEDKNTGLPELRRLVGKLHARRSAERLFAGHWAVWRRTLGRVSIAPPVGYLAVAGLSLQEFVSGIRLADLAGPGRVVGRLREAARSVGIVHSLTLPLLRRRGVDKEMAGVDRWIGVLSGLRPDHAKRIETIGVRLRRELSDRIRVTGTVHGDFHLANVLANDHGITLLDWDQIAHGDPMVDVGRVLASLRVSSLRVHGTMDGFADVEEACLRAYLEQTKDDESRARLFEAVALLTAAAAPFRLQRQGWEQSAELILDEVERTLELSLRGPRIQGASLDKNLEVTFADRRQWALDRPYSQALLIPIVHKAYGSDIEVIKTRPTLLEDSDERLHVRWDLRGYKGKSPWSAVLEGVSLPDDRGRGRLRRLALAGDALTEHPEALQLPRALGCLDPIAMQVVAPPPGQPMSKLLSSPDETAAIRQLSCALANFHSLPVNLLRERETASVTRSIERRIERLEENGHPEAAAAREMFERLESILAGVGERRAPTVKGLRLRELRVNSTGAGAAVLDDVVLAEPLLTVGDLSAQLRSYALKRDVPPTAAELFHECYLDASGDVDGALPAFEALGLLGRACRFVVKDAADPLVAPLIEAARERLSACPL